MNAKQRVLVNGDTAPILWEALNAIAMRGFVEMDLTTVLVWRQLFIAISVLKFKNTAGSGLSDIGRAPENYFESSGIRINWIPIYRTILG